MGGTLEGSALLFGGGHGCGQLPIEETGDLCGNKSDRKDRKMF